ncbi:MAG: acetyl-CoA carboxylase biotin carboxyl carrier protein [Acholeplasmatales bacterium]|nr:acetyl-CoA carboxylase biotin carboxyl carrier protein [Acholeplasmatales bacterium]
MEFEDLKKVIKIFEDSKLTVLEYETEGFKVKLDKRQGGCAPMPAPMPMAMAPQADVQAASQPQAQDDKDFVKSPLVGTFHAAPAPSAKPFVSVGSKVKKGDKLCIIEAMKVMNEILAPKDATIKDILVKNGEMVEFDQNLFVLGD